MAMHRATPERYRKEAARIRKTAAAADEETRAHLLVTARLYEQMAESLPKQPRRNGQHDGDGNPSHQKTGRRADGSKQGAQR